MPDTKFSPFTNKLDFVLNETELLAELDDQYLKLDTTNDPLTGNLAIESDDATLFLEDTSPTVISGSADSKYWSIRQTSLILGSLFAQLSIAPETLDRKSHSLSIDSQIILFPNIPDGAEDCNLIRFNSTYDNDGGEVYLLRDSSTVNMDNNNSVVGTLLVDGQINQSVNAVNGYTMFNSTLIINYDTNGAATGITTNINDQTTLQANGIAMSDVVSTNYRTIYSRPKFRSTSSGTARFNDIYGLEVAHIFRYESGTTLNIKGDWFGLKVNQITEEVSTGTLTFPGKTYGAFIGSQTVGTENYGIWIDDAEDGALVLDADGLSGRILLGENQEASIDYSSASNLVLHAQRSGSGHIVLHSPKTSTGDPTGVEGKIYWNTVDNVIKMYADGAWRTLASW